ncbi:MAG: tRNA 5-hydroxyuridine modification protein YegQ [gamma proteobacterium symbiont of Bathyaustriella thionipta]|nr:tRNA 5-hydroxyuridine modification protein YegQ [gamma proteobacterium symbiont of Bathyaustriella thionipta]
MTKTPELLSPAGTLRNMRYAFAYGADAVYAGLPRYSLRVRNNDFNHERLKKGIDEAHAQNKQFFVAVNLMPHGAKLKTFMDDMQPVVDMQPDAFIMADPGLIMMVRERWPDLAVHLSVQANTVNSAAVRFWQQMGLTRVILSRELSLDEIRQIRQQCPDMQLEVFVHGALCIAYSGRCLLSGYFNHRDANQGSCTNSCRWNYKIGKNELDAVAELPVENIQRHPAADDMYYLEEEHRPGELMPVFEDEHGTYIMNSKDLRAVEHVHQLTRIGIDCLKIEGRTKSHYYTARTTQVYRQAIDDAVAGRDFNPHLISDLEGLANRGYTDGFYQRHESNELQNYRQAASQNSKEIFVAEVEYYDNDSGLYQVLAKNRFCQGDELHMLTSQGNHRFELTEVISEAGESMQTVPGGGYRVKIALPASANSHTLITRFIQ